MCTVLLGQRRLGPDSQLTGLSTIQPVTSTAADSPSNSNTDNACALGIRKITCTGAFLKIQVIKYLWSEQTPYPGKLINRAFLSLILELHSAAPSTFLLFCSFVVEVLASIFEFLFIE